MPDTKETVTQLREKLDTIHQILNEEPNGAEGDKRAVKRIREVLYSAAEPEPPEDDPEGSEKEAD